MCVKRLSWISNYKMRLYSQTMDKSDWNYSKWYIYLKCILAHSISVTNKTNVSKIFTRFSSEFFLRNKVNYMRKISRIYLEKRVNKLRSCSRKWIGQLFQKNKKKLNCTVAHTADDIFQTANKVKNEPVAPLRLNEHTKCIITSQTVHFNDLLHVDIQHYFTADASLTY